MWVGAGKDVTTTVPRDFLGHLGALTRVVHLGVVDLKSSIIVISLLLSGSFGCQVSEHDFSVIFKISVPQSFDNISLVSCRSSYISKHRAAASMACGRFADSCGHQLSGHSR